jgi:hypothetical protein
MLVTLETSQPEMSSLKLVLPKNNRYMVVTFETSQAAISPNEAVTVALSVPPLHHKVTALPILASVRGSAEGADDGAREGDADGSEEGA